MIAAWNYVIYERNDIIWLSLFDHKWKRRARYSHRILEHLFSTHILKFEFQLGIHMFICAAAELQRMSESLYHETRSNAKHLVIDSIPW